jgi:hypothetical protein
MQVHSTPFVRCGGLRSLRMTALRESAAARRASFLNGRGRVAAVGDESPTYLLFADKRRRANTDPFDSLRPLRRTSVAQDDSVEGGRGCAACFVSQWAGMVCGSRGRIPDLPVVR